MIDERYKQLKSIVNSSGFIFQLALEHKIKSTRAKHGWEVVNREHPWHDEETQVRGYIDLILAKDRMRIVIECKRPQDASWIFINPNKKRDEVDRARLLWTFLSVVPPGVTYSLEPKSDWSDFEVTPESPESEFCSIRGKGEKDSPLLERISGQLLTSIECLAREEIELTRDRRHDKACIYIPVIVTTAQLELCHFELASISISDGKLSEGTFTNIPFIRFRKSLTTILSPHAYPANTMEANADKERSIFVVTAGSICNMLESMKCDRMAQDEPWPWRR